MRIFWLLLAAIVVGTLLGVGSMTATYRTAYGRLTEEVLFPPENEPIGPGGDDFAPGKQPRLTVDNEHYDFGVLENGEEGEHSFVLVNDGGSNLEIELLEISCKCTSADLAAGRKVEIKPGESFDVKLSWHANSSTGQFRQAATLSSNDPRHTQFNLIVTGKVVKGVVATPLYFPLDGISIGKSFERKIHIHSYRSKDFKVLGHELLPGIKTELFDLSFEPVAVDEKAYPGALAAVEATLKVKPGLPIGNVNQSVIVRTNDARKPEMNLSIFGTVDGPVSLSGMNWNPKASLLKIGAYTREEGHKATLVLKIIDVDPALLHPKIIKVVPSEIQVKLGEPRVIDSADRPVVIYELTLEIPANGPVLTYLDTAQSPPGLIEIDTGHAGTGVLRMNLELVSVD